MFGSTVAEKRMKTLAQEIPKVTEVVPGTTLTEVEALNHMILGEIQIHKNRNWRHNVLSRMNCLKVGKACTCTTRKKRGGGEGYW